MRSPHPGPLVKSALIFAFVLILMLLAFAGPLREASVATPEDEYLSNSEALNNVVKHSSAREAKVDASGMNEAIDLCISDAGVGFDPELAKEKAGLGRISMREPLRLVGGQLSVESEPFHGTKICARVPLLGTIPGETDSTSRVTTAEDREVPHG